jgi:hypothetical protein
MVSAQYFLLLNVEVIRYLTILDRDAWLQVSDIQGRHGAYVG